MSFCGLLAQFYLQPRGARFRPLPLLQQALAAVAARAAAAAAAAAAPLPPPPTTASLPHFWRGPAIAIQSMQYGTELGDADYDGYFENTLFRDTHGAYPLMIVADIFLHCATSSVHVVSRHYYRSPGAQNFSDRALGGAAEGGGGGVELKGNWFVYAEYETSAVGIFPYPAAALPGGPCAAPAAGSSSAAPQLRARVAFREANATFLLPPTPPQPPPSRFAMCAVFSFNAYMLKLWSRYWALLGIETFYFFYNGDPRDIPALNASLAGLRAHVVWVQWPLLHWIITDSRDITHGQPMAITDCLQRWRERHEFMFFYDLDEFLVLPRHDGLNSFMDEYLATDHGAGPLVALRTQSAWAMFNFTPSGHNIADINVTEFALLPIHRGVPNGREKYWINTTAIRIEFSGWGTDDFKSWPSHPVHNLNLHGVYQVQEGELAHVRILRGEGGKFPAYHLHLLNTRSPERTMDGRDAFFPKNPVLEEEAGPFVRRMLLRRLAEREGRLGERGG